MRTCLNTKSIPSFTPHKLDCAGLGGCGWWFPFRLNGIFLGYFDFHFVVRDTSVNVKVIFFENVPFWDFGLLLLLLKPYNGIIY